MSAALPRSLTVKCLFTALFLLALSAIPLAAQQWVPLGPDGGDVRSLAYDPTSPDKIYLGTSTGQLFTSNDDGRTWLRLAQFGTSNDFVVDHIAVTLQDGTLYVATWSVQDNEVGDLFRSRDHGKTWDVLPGMHGKSIRSFAIAASDPKILIAGTLDGVYRSFDGGHSWDRISPDHHAELKNIESLAIDPRDPNVIYAGTWHLPWKTSDGGASWHSIKQGVIDDSDVFSIIVSHANPSVVYASACSGIYKSDNAAALFHKIQGIPSSARRTRVLRQDPSNPDVVYAGTTEGLWKTVDGGATFKRITATNIIVNDVLIDPRRPTHVLVATDRSGVLLSDDAGATFAASNRGFSHRHVASFMVDRNDPNVMYAGLVNDKEFGGVFATTDGGATWAQRNAGLGTRDVFVLRQLASGELLAGTNSGLFTTDRRGSQWRALGEVVGETQKTVAVKGSKRTRTVSSVAKKPLSGRVYDIALLGDRMYASTALGLLSSDDEGRTWRVLNAHPDAEIVSIHATPQIIVAAASRKLLASVDKGQSWYEAKLPSYITKLNSVTVDAKTSTIWIATREGALRSSDGGDTWEHVLDGLPYNHLLSIVYDEEGKRLLATAADTSDLFESTDSGRNWRRLKAGFPLRNVVSVRGRIFASTAYDGVIAESVDAPARAAAGSGGGNAQR
jgi:photosystem II stability/assembly factor-like uncharacterized protein